MDSPGGSELSYNMPLRSMLHGDVLSPEWDSSLTLSKAERTSRETGQENIRLKSGKVCCPCGCSQKTHTRLGPSMFHRHGELMVAGSGTVTVFGGVATVK